MHVPVRNATLPAETIGWQRFHISTAHHPNGVSQ
jgi:hypothetical protein